MRPRFLHHAFDPKRFCNNCGRENEVAAMKEYGGDTGRVTGIRWSVSCPTMGLTPEGDSGWSANGYRWSHYASPTAFEPSWLTPEQRAYLVEAGRWGGRVPSEIEVPA